MFERVFKGRFAKRQVDSFSITLHWLLTVLVNERP
jgi:hypothetical protein